jgi:sec-independent protein translocase protein TatC
MTKIFRKKRSDPDAMTLVEHLAELRKRLVISAFAVTLGAIVAYVFYDAILRFFMHPLCVVDGPNHCTLYVNGPLDGFTWRVKISGFAGLFVALPVVMYQLWAFIAPGLKKSEKRYAIPFVFVSFVLFLSGAYIAYLVFPKALLFLQGAAGPQIHPLYTPQSYLGFIVVLMAAFGAAFEFPVILVTLELLGVVTPARLAKGRRWAIVLIFAAGAIFIPSSDPYSLFALTIPLVIFYELSIAIGRVLTRGRQNLSSVS